MPPPRRKKWTEAEEKTLIEKYGEMICDGSLAKMKTREKKYKPISLYVNSVHHVRDPVAYPWPWTWKDVSTKVQNMRHQYSLVKQKIRRSDSGGSSSVGAGAEEFDWVEGVAHWSNFLRYKEVFGDVAALYGGNDPIAVGAEFNGNIEIGQFGHLGEGEDGDFGGGMDGVENGVMGLEFDYDGEEGAENYHGNDNDGNNMKEDVNSGFVYEDIEPMGSDTRKKRKALKGTEKGAWGIIANQLGLLREMETRLEQREVERERERQRREAIRIEIEQEHEQKWEERKKEMEEREKAREKLRRQRTKEWEAMEKESEQRERRRKEEEMIYERKWEERMSRRRSEWKKRIDETLSQHREEMGQMQTRILHEQQNLASQLLGIVSQWTGHPTGLADHTGANNHYLSQMVQNLHHINGIVHADTRVDGDNQDDHFIVDG
ncbi:hypothetical protein RJ639_018252 [Escallonia herrerae]|uniref:Uncharacterized protein n=1 Tax=Escallonia herrerae TaxID=1293975 RepID=A0AA88VC53_9ASTE|nr:hypothetical protein RJ639_018252 [Escallonia herrerae]